MGQSEIVICKKCKGKPPRRNQLPCATCGGAGSVRLVDKDGRKVIARLDEHNVKVA